MFLSWYLIFQVHENAYLSDFHHCFSLPSNSSGKSADLSASVPVIVLVPNPVLT